MGKALIAQTSANGAIGTGKFFGPVGDLFSASAFGTEVETAFKARIAGTFSLLAVNANATGTSRTVRFRLNAANGNQVVTPTNTTAGVYADTTNSDTISSGDTFDLGYTSTGSPTYNWSRVVFTASSNHACYYGAQRNSTYSANTTYFIPAASFTLGNTTESNVKLKIRAGGSGKNLSVYLVSNSLSGAGMVVRSRKNGANGSLSISITNGVTGLYEDSSNSDSLSSGDDYCMSAASTAGSGSMVISLLGWAVENTADTKNDLFTGAGGSSGHSRSASGSASFYPITGGGGFTTTEAACQIQHGFAATVTRLRVLLTANSYSASGTIKSRLNGADGALTATITAGVTGIYEDTTNSENVGATDNYCTAIVGGTSGSITFFWLGVTEQEAGGSTQTLTPSLFTNTQTFYAPTVAAGAVTLTPSLFTNTNSFFAPTVTRGTVTLTPSLVTNSQTFYGPTVSPTYSLTPGLLTNAQTFYGPSISVGAVTLTPSLFTNTQTFYGPTMTSGLLPSLVTNAQTFFAPTVAPGTATLTPSLVTNTQTFFGPVVTTLTTLTPALFTNVPTFYGPTVVPGAVTLAPSLLTNAQTFYGPVVSSGQATILPPLLANTQTFHAATVTRGPVSLAPSLFTNAQTFYGPTVTRGTVTLTPSLLTNAQTFYAPTVSRGTVTLTPGLVTNSQTFFGPTVQPGAVILAPLLVANDNEFFAPDVSGGTSELLPPLLTNISEFYPPSYVGPPIRKTTGGVRLSSQEAIRYGSQADNTARRGADHPRRSQSASPRRA